MNTWQVSPLKRFMASLLNHSSNSCDVSIRQPVRAGRPTILYLVHRVPYPPDKGDRIRNLQILRFLSQFADVDLACLADEPVDSRAGAIFDELCRQWYACTLDPLLRRLKAAASVARGRTMSEGAFWSRKFCGTLEKWTVESTYDAVVASSSAMMQYLDIPRLTGTRAIVDLIDVDSEKWATYARSSLPPLSWLYALEGRRLRRVERELKPNVAAVVVVSEDEAALYRNVCKDGPVHAVGNGVDLEYFSGDPHPQSNAGPCCIFVGSMDYPPNVDAAVWFTQNVWPAIRHKFQDARFTIVGRNPARSVRKLAFVPGVEVTGTVADVRPWYANATMALAPLRIARGIQNKVLEAMAMRLPTVVSPQALCGLSARSGDEILVANTSVDWIHIVSKLLQDSLFRRRIGEAGRAYVELHHSWTNRLLPLRELLKGQPAGSETAFTAPNL